MNPKKEESKVVYATGSFAWKLGENLFAFACRLMLLSVEVYKSLPPNDTFLAEALSLALIKVAEKETGKSDYVFLSKSLENTTTCESLVVAQFIAPILQCQGKCEERRQSAHLSQQHGEEISSFVLKNLFFFFCRI